ncbi:MAG TPA: translocation/assembly module TamB domain-containing protein [Gemmatimonadaceae bacterium]|nr:translocation/assembly module TamB domain-containing protein [Gemmatimonadaceae bacterium]
MRRGARIALSITLVLALLLVVALAVFTRTNFGRGRIHSYALNSLRSSVNGIVNIGRLEGNVLGNFALVDVSITDSAGRPFISADRVEARVNASALFSKRIAVSRLHLVRPVIHLSKTPDEDWNYARLFESEGGVDSTLGFGDWVSLRNVTMRDGSLTIERPWTPDAGLPSVEREQVIARAVAGESRTRVERVDYGWRQTVDFRSINATMSEIIVADPENSEIVLRIDSLAMVAAPFHPPQIDVRQFAGEVRIGEDTVTAPEFVLNLPQTRTTGSFRYHLATGDMFGTLKADTLALRDIRALYPVLPDSGGGRMTMTLAVRDTGVSEYAFTDTDLRLAGATLRGQLGLVVDEDFTALRDTDLQFAQLPTRLIEELAPGAEFPVPAHLTGRARIEGQPSGMRVDADATYDPLKHPAFRILARGGLAFENGLTMNRLYVRGDRVPVAVLKDLGVDLPIGGVLNANATLSGTTASRLRGPYNLVHNENGNVSRISGTAAVALRQGPRMDVTMRLQPVSLELAQRFVEKTDIRGEVTGSGRLQGTPRDLGVILDLNLPDTGFMHVEGTLRRPNDNVPVYSATLTMRDVDVSSVVARFPQTTVEGVTSFEGRGSTLPTLDARLNANLKILTVDSAEFRDVIVVAAANNGELKLDTLHANAPFGFASAAGTFGLTAERQGSLKYRTEVTDVSGLRRWIGAVDTSTVEARPLIGARLQRARQYADSVRRAMRAHADPAAELAASMQQRPERPAPRVVADVPPIRRDSLAGSLAVSGDAQGNVKRFTLNARAETPGLVWSGNLFGAGSVTAKWTDVGTPNNKLEAQGGVDSLRMFGFAFDSTRFRGTYANGQGDAAVTIFPGDTAEYRVEGTYALHADHGEVHLRNVQLQFDSTAWATTRESTIAWRGRGLTIDSLELRDRAGRGGGRIFINGELPDVDPGRIEVAVDSLRMAPWLTLLQSDVNADGILTFTSMIEGTRTAPRINANLVLTDPRYRGAEFPEVHTRLTYADRALDIDGSMRRTNDGELAHITGKLPIDLSLGDSVKTRLLDAPIALTIEGDSIPLSPLTEFTTQVTALDGKAFGRIAINGTWSKPRLAGDLGIEARRADIAATGVTINSIAGHLRTSGDTLVIDSLKGHQIGPMSVGGTVVLTQLDHPVLGLTFEASRARLLHDGRGSLVGDVNVRINGPLDTLTVTGSAIMRHGVVYMPDPERKNIINTEDPVIFAVIDTALARELDIAPPSAMLRNMTLDVDLEVRRGVFARSPDANIEIYGNIDLEMNRSTNGKVAVTGALFTDYGDYTFLGKRFDVSRGSARFTGEPDPNPALQVMATHEVRQAGRPPLEIRVVIGGTMRRPTLSLESDAQPTLSQSDLIAFLAFGQSSSSLLQFAGTGLEGGGAQGSSLAGSVGALARRQLASIAMGAMIESAKSDLASATRADVLNITPAELPADVSLGSLQTILRGTEIEIGKYADRHTFVLGRVRPSMAIPGALVERRIGQQYTIRGTFETRLQPQRPSLSAGLTPKTVQVLGALFAWKLAW